MVSNHSSKSTVLNVVAIIRKEKKRDRATSRASTQPSSDFVILVNVELYIHTYIIDHYNPSVRITA